MRERSAQPGTEPSSRGGDGIQPERVGGCSGAGAQLARPGVRGAADRGDHLREPAGVSQRPDGEGTENHHQLLHRQPGGGGSDARGARPAALRLLRGEVCAKTRRSNFKVDLQMTNNTENKRVLLILIRRFFFICRAMHFY